MLRTWIFALVTVLSPAGAYALDTVTCADAKGEVSLTYVIGQAFVQPILSVEMQLTDDFGVSTNGDSPDYDGEYISRGFVGEDVEGADVSWRDDKAKEHLTLSFRIGRVSEGQKAAVGGVLSVVGGGLWTVSCRSSNLGM
ncbi:hypothetical protein [Devosia sp.]|uniref:hypothetical protein n=1 Tax=Devosia sp. TaxID=1871048 RepID=UPI001AC8BE44|nr:hypothetical protein [Devosia sp.]MBN9336221.1 hypothetical protein [Devosia sp.]